MGPGGTLENKLSPPVQCTPRHIFSRHSVLQGSGAGYPGLLVKSSDGYYFRRIVAEKTTRGAQRGDGCGDTTVNERGMNAAVTGLTEAVRTMGQSMPQPRPADMRVGKPSGVRSWLRL